MIRVIHLSTEVIHIVDNYIVLFVDTKLFRLKTGQAMLVLTVEKRLELKDAFSFSRLTAPAPSWMEPKRFENAKIN